jgi:hypothetical protein
VNGKKKEPNGYSRRKNRKPGTVSSQKKKRQYSMVRPLYQEALKSLFLVCVLLVDTLIPLEVFRILPAPFNSIVSLVILGIFLYIEIVMYNSLWGKKGRWSIDKYKKSFEKRVEEKKT